MVDVIREEFTFTSADGQTPIHCIFWLPSDETAHAQRGIVQLAHGMEEYISRYDEFANFLAKNGFLVVGHDHIGHGKSVKSDKELGNLDCENGWFKMTEDIHILQNQIAKN